MVKPITKETLFMNCMELEFWTKVELEHWMATFEEKVWIEDVMKELSKAGLVRRTVAQVWNKQNHRLTSTFEYENENAYKACQKIIEEKVMPKAQASYTIKARNNRGVIFYDYKSWFISLKTILEDKSLLQTY